MNNHIYVYLIGDACTSYSIVSLIITKKFIPDEITKNELTTRTKVEEIEIMVQGIYSG